MPKTTKERRTKRSRTSVARSEERPRVTVFRSNKYIYSQIVDDETGTTLVTIDDISRDAHKGKTKKEAAKELGKTLAERALEKDIKEVVFDKGSYKYHGRVKSFAEGAREGGLIF